MEFNVIYILLLFFFLYYILFFLLKYLPLNTCFKFIVFIINIFDIIKEELTYLNVGFYFIALP